MKNNSRSSAVGSVFFALSILAAPGALWAQHTTPKGDEIIDTGKMLAETLAGKATVNPEALPNKLVACKTNKEDPAALPACSDVLARTITQEAKAIVYLESLVSPALLEGFRKDLKSAAANRDKDVLLALRNQVESVQYCVHVLLETRLSLWDYTPPSDMRQPYAEACVSGKVCLKALAQAALTKLDKPLEALFVGTGQALEAISGNTTPN